MLSFPYVTHIRVRRFPDLKGLDNIMAKKSSGSANPENVGDSNTITLQHSGTQKNGLVSYNREGVRSSVYFGKGMFGAGVTPPSSITITGSGFALPGETRDNETDPAKLAAKQEKAQAVALKAQERANKAIERAKAAQTKAEAAARKAGVAAPEASSDSPAM